jgi:hypothetical protein
MPPKKQRVIVSYSGSDTIKVPKGVDLEAPGVEYFVKWGTLYITLPNGKSIEVEGNADSEIINWQYPDFQNETDTDSSDSDSSDNDSETCEVCGKKLSDIVLTEEKVDEHPDRKEGHDSEGQCKDCRKGEEA